MGRKKNDEIRNKMNIRKMSRNLITRHLRQVFDELPSDPENRYNALSECFWNKIHKYHHHIAVRLIENIEAKMLAKTCEFIKYAQLLSPHD